MGGDAKFEATQEQTYSFPTRKLCGWEPKDFVREVTVNKIRARRAITDIESSSQPQI